MTIKEIAKRADVSIGTVDRVIHNRGKVSKEKKEKILKILKEVNYSPNIYARGLVLNKSYTIAALIPEFDKGEYWGVPYSGVKQAFNELRQYGINLNYFHFDQNSIESFISQYTAVEKSKPDGVILAPVINFESVKFCSKLVKQKIPFTIIDSNIKDSGAISFIGQDANQSGRLAAKLMDAYVGHKGKVLIVSIRNNENHNKTLQARTEGFKDFFLTSGNLENIILEEISIDQRESNWKDSLEQIILEKMPLGIYVPSSKVHFVAEIIDKNKFSCRLIGNDLIDNNLYYVESGTIDFIIGQRPETQGYLALVNLYKHLVSKQSIESTIYLPIDIITEENLKYYKSHINY